MKRLTDIIYILSVATMILTACKKNINTPAQDISPSLAEPFIETAPPVLKPHSIDVNGAIPGFYSGVPAGYDSTQAYPLLVFLPGAGQFGNGKIDLPLLLNDGIVQLLDEKKFPPHVKVNGRNFSFITITPQFSRYPSTWEILSLVE